MKARTIVVSLTSITGDKQVTREGVKDARNGLTCGTATDLSFLTPKRGCSRVTGKVVTIPMLTFDRLSAKKQKSIFALANT